MGKTQTRAVQGEETKEVAAKQETPAAAEAKIKKRNIDVLRIYIAAKWNNTFVTATDNTGRVLFRVSTGQAGFKGNRKSTPFAGSRAAGIALDKLRGIETREVHVFVKGVGPGRDSALKTLFSRDLPFQQLVDITPVPLGGGPQPVKRRRV